MTVIDFQTAPERYRHWRLSTEGAVATLAMDVAEDGGLKDGYELKLNSYDLGVDIELYDAVQRLRFEHPEVRVVVLTSAKENVFCAGANIRMLGGAAHAEKVNFCKFTNETRLAIEDASAHSGQRYLAAIKGACAGGGYELALAADHLMLVDDGSSAVSLPEVPLLAVLPGTGGLTRLVDKRKIRRDHADLFCTLEEGARGKRALEWRLVDELVPRSSWDARVAARADELAAGSSRPENVQGIALTPLEIDAGENHWRAGPVSVAIARDARYAEITIEAPAEAPPQDARAIHAEGARFWPLALARALEGAILHLRANEPTIGTWLLRTVGAAEHVVAADAALMRNTDWLSGEIRHYLKRVLKRLDVSARSLFALIEPGSCFAGTLAELAFAADRTYMLDGTFEDDNRPPARLTLTEANFGAYPMATGLTRLACRFYGEPETVETLRQDSRTEFDALEALERGLVTSAPDDIDWEDEVRIAIEERTSFSPDAMTGLEASLRFPGPETMESKIFARLSAWQNWIFQRPNAIGAEGALARYGSGKRPDFDWTRT